MAGSRVPVQFGELLVALGFRPVLAVEKNRLPGHLAWDGFHVEIAVDDVVLAGQFLELEISATDSSVENAKCAIHALARQLGLAEVERRSYLEMVLQDTT